MPANRTTLHSEMEQKLIKFLNWIELSERKMFSEMNHFRYFLYWMKCTKAFNVICNENSTFLFPALFHIKMLQNIHQERSPITLYSQCYFLTGQSCHPLFSSQQSSWRTEEEAEEIISRIWYKHKNRKISGGKTKCLISGLSYSGRGLGEKPRIFNSQQSFSSAKSNHTDVCGIIRSLSLWEYSIVDLQESSELLSDLKVDLRDCARFSVETKEHFEWNVV